MVLSAGVTMALSLFRTRFRGLLRWPVEVALLGLLGCGRTPPAPECHGDPDCVRANGEGWYCDQHGQPMCLALPRANSPRPSPLAAVQFQYRVTSTAVALYGPRDASSYEVV